MANPMEYRTLGRTGLNVSALAFGCGDVGGLMVRGEPVDRERAIARAVELGINYLDTAPSYGSGESEKNLGVVLRALRPPVIVGTKCRLSVADMADVPGALARSVERSLELLGRGDLFRPWQDDSASFSRQSWTVLEPAALAVLDQSLAAHAREMPQLLETLTDRALRRSRRLAVSAAIANTVGVGERLLLSLWQLTELWGRRVPGGAVLPFRLSHQTLADLVGARRPTVTLALRNLAQRELLRRGESGEWILIGDPP